MVYPGFYWARSLLFFTIPWYSETRWYSLVLRDFSGPSIGLLLCWETWENLIFSPEKIIYFYERKFYIFKRENLIFSGEKFDIFSRKILIFSREKRWEKKCQSGYCKCVLLAGCKSLRLNASVFFLVLNGELTRKSNSPYL